jgi:hypothetical protein
LWQQICVIHVTVGGHFCEIFGDPVVATALLDRLLHHAVVTQIEGSSYRLRQTPNSCPSTSAPRPSSTRRCQHHAAAAGRPSRKTKRQPTPDHLIIAKAVSWGNFLRRF